MDVFGVAEAILKFQLLMPTISHKSVEVVSLEIRKSARWRQLNSHQQSNDTKYGYVPVSWLAVGRGATDGPPHFVIMLYLYSVVNLKAEDAASHQ